jgi:hypothetical protein
MLATAVVFLSLSVAQAPPVPQGPPVRPEPAPVKPVKSCSCSPECTCGCNEGEPCKCQRSSRALPALQGVTPQIAPVVLPQIHYHQPQTYFAAPVYSHAPMQSYAAPMRAAASC